MSNPNLTEVMSSAFEVARASVESSRPSPDECGQGRGIIIPAGGPKYVPCAYVNVKMLRHLGCALPVEIWHLGENEIDPEIRSIFQPEGVRFVDALSMRDSVKALNGWELKAFAMLQSSFAEVLLLDADNVPVADPTFLFETQPYLAHGAIFWPDFGCLAPSHRIWTIAGIPYRDEPEFESGQIVVDRRRCWRELSLAMWMNDHSDFWYRHIHGDKETFHLAWRKLGREYAMPGRPIDPLPGVMCQHDFEGRRIFQHRNLCKFTIDGPNERVPGFLFEEQCLNWLAELKALWSRRPHRQFDDTRADEPARRAARRLCTVRWLYRRLGHDERPMIFATDGTIAEGAAGCERTWNVTSSNDGLVMLVICGKDGLTCTMYPDSPQSWAGHWEIHERMPVTLIAIDDIPPAII